MASLKLPTLKQLEKVSVNDAFEWLSSLEHELKNALAAFPAAETRIRRNLQKRLDRLQDRREEFKAQRQT